MTIRTLKFAGRIRESLQEVMPSMSREWHENSCVITDVAMTKDLSIAKVYVMNMKGEGDFVLEKLNKVSKLAARKVARQNGFRRVPQIRFKPDESYAESIKLAHLSQLLEADAQAN